MIAHASRQTAQRINALRALSNEQDALADSGLQKTYSQAEIARRTAWTRCGVERTEMAAKLRFLARLARRHPQSFLDLGGSYEQLGFLRSITITSTNVRQLWRRWSLTGR